MFDALIHWAMAMLVIGVVQVLLLVMIFLRLGKGRHRK